MTSHLRRQVLTLEPAKFGITPDPAGRRVFAVLLDWHVADGPASLVCDHTGFLALGTPTTYGIRGGPDDHVAKSAAMALVQAAEARYDDAVPGVEQTLPGPGMARFHLLGFRGGVRSIEATAEARADGNHQGAELWQRAEAVLEAFRASGSDARLGGCEWSG